MGYDNTLADSEVASAKAFAELSDEDVLKLKECRVRWGGKEGDGLTWNIVPQGQTVEAGREDGMHNPHVKMADAKEELVSRIRKHVGGKRADQVLLDDLFPDIKGRAVDVCKMLADPRSQYHGTWKNWLKGPVRVERLAKSKPPGLRDDWMDRVKETFPADPQNPDSAAARAAADLKFTKRVLEIVRDEDIRTFILMIAAGGTEHCVGVDNFFKTDGAGITGRKSAPAFGRYMHVNKFKCIGSALPYAWAEKMYWFMPVGSVPWEVFMPILDSLCEKRKDLIKATFLLLDESMSGWCPKTSKYGGLPNYIFEGRKPVSLGSMLRDAVEVMSGVLMYLDPAMSPERQQVKVTECGPPELTPSNATINAGCAEAIRATKASKVPAGGWVGGDAWFGSVMTCLELKQRLGVYSTWVVKNCTHLFPKVQLGRLLRARCKAEGHDTVVPGVWATMTTTVKDCTVIAMAYSWSKTGVSYFVSTCGSTAPEPDKYMSAYEDELGSIIQKEVPRAALAGFLFRALPLIDLHNKDRQGILGLERKWPTKDCWFRLLTTVVGMVCVDTLRIFRLLHPLIYGDMPITDFVDLMTMPLEDIPKAKQAAVAAADSRVPIGAPRLGRITNGDGKATKSKSPNENSARNEMGAKTGGSVTFDCHVCKFYRGEGSKRVDTSFRCPQCETPVCNLGNMPRYGRQLSCYEEHLKSGCDHIRCTGQRKGRVLKAHKADAERSGALKRKAESTTEQSASNKAPRTDIPPPPPSLS